MSDHLLDLLVIGGGINGAGIANDAAGRGLSVALCEQGDLAGATSSSSTKLIHGGLRYLDYYEFGLVRKALKEREVLLRKAPHITRPLSFVLPHQPHLKPIWIIRLGLFLYDHLAQRKTLSGSKKINLNEANEGKPLKHHLTQGFRYSDGWVDDARLVVLNAIQAREHGAQIFTQTRCSALTPQGDHWEVQLTHTDQTTQTLSAKTIINASGPWVDETLASLGKLTSQHAIKKVKGSHIVVPRLYEGEQAYILQHEDKRIIFAIPYEQDFTLIGTTEVACDSVDTKPKITVEETTYLCDIINQYFHRQITPDDVIWSYAGIRPLLDDAANNASAVTRDYKLEWNHQGVLNILSVYGGKITTYRKLAEDALTLLKPYFPQMKPAWTANTPLPGGDFDCFQTQLKNFIQNRAWLPPNLAERYLRCYGTRANFIMQNAKSLVDLGQHFGAGLYQNEVDYLIKQEWARTVEDILWRRTKLGLRLTNPVQIQQLENYLHEHLRTAQTANH